MVLWTVVFNTSKIIVDIPVPNRHICFRIELGVDVLWKKRWKALIYKLLDFICYWQFFLENICWLFWFWFVSSFLDGDKKRTPWTKLTCLRMVCKPVRNNRCIIECPACYDYNHCCSWFMQFLTWSDMSPQNPHEHYLLYIQYDFILL